jgi:hypothetical protein
MAGELRTREKIQHEGVAYPLQLDPFWIPLTADADHIKPLRNFHIRTLGSIHVRLLG